MGESGPSAGYAGPPPTPGSFGSGAGGPQAGWDPNAMMQTWQGYTPAQQQPWLDSYKAGDPGQQQQWLDFLGQSDPTGGVNNPNYVAPPPPAPPDPTKAQYPGAPVDPTTWTPDPANPPGTPAPTPGAGAEGGNPWDDLTSPRFQAWFTQQLQGGQSPGLNFTGQDPTSAYGTYNSQAEQAALMAEFQKLPPEVQAAYVAEYMKRTPEEQQMWRNAFGADNSPVGNDPASYTGPQNRSTVPKTGNNQVGGEGSFEAAWADPVHYYPNGQMVLAKGYTIGPTGQVVKMGPG